MLAERSCVRLSRARSMQTPLDFLGRFLRVRIMECVHETIATRPDDIRCEGALLQCKALPLCRLCRGGLLLRKFAKGGENGSA